MIDSKRYLSISVMMLVILFMFMFQPVVKNITNEYDSNTHVKSSKYNSEDIFQATSTVAEAGKYVIYVGARDTQLYSNVLQWCNYTKRALVCFDDMEGFSNGQYKNPFMLVLKGSETDMDEWLDTIKSIADNGANVVFADMPDCQTIENNSELMDLFGIIKIENQQQDLTGIKLFSGFLLGGEGIYQAKTAEDKKKQDLELQTPWYILGNKTKTYMVGLVEDGSVKNEILPAIVWRHTSESGQIFCVNGNYMDDIMGMGFLQGMATQCEEYSVYPVVNAQNLVVSNYPGLATENAAKMNEFYSRSQSGVFEDIVWPEMTAICKSTHFKMTMMMAPQMDYDDDNEPKVSELTEYLREVNEEDAEMGISMEHVGNIYLSDKIKSDNEFIKKSGVSYKFASAVVAEEDLTQFSDLLKEEKVENIQTITSSYSKGQSLLSYFSDNVTMQYATSSDFEFKYSSDIRNKAIETVLAYNNVNLDMQSILWPESEDDRWENYFKNVTANLYSYGEEFEKFDATTLSESDVRVRRFLALDYTETSNGNKHTIEIKNVKGNTWFIYRQTGYKIKKITGGTYEEIENGVYLIKATKSRVVFTTKSKNSLYYTMPD